MYKRVFVSDIHMTAGWGFTGSTGAYDWFTKKNAADFLAFLKYVRGDASINEVILLGDIMDGWLYPYDVQPPSYEVIADAFHIKPIIQELQLLAQVKPVTYVEGNHDINITDAAFAGFRTKYFPNIPFQKKPYVTNDGIYAKHGHEYLMWNAPDPNPNHKLPIGYYITRLQAGVHAYAQMLFTIPDIASTILHELSSPTALTDAPLDFLIKNLNKVRHVDDKTQIVNAAGATAIGQVRNDYAGLTSDWEHHSKYGPVKSIEFEADDIWEPANDLAFATNNKIIVFGHKHKEGNTLLQPAAGGTPWGIYANCGSWCDLGSNDPSYIVTEYDKAGQTHSVTLWHWRKQSPVYVLSNQINIP